MTSRLGERSPHNSYDEIASDLKKAAARFAAPLALRARQRAVVAERETRENKRLSDRIIQARRNTPVER